MTARMKRISSKGSGIKKKNVPESREISFQASPASACNDILDFFVPGNSDCFVPQHYVTCMGLCLHCNLSMLNDTGIYSSAVIYSTTGMSAARKACQQMHATPFPLQSINVQ